MRNMRGKGTMYKIFLLVVISMLVASCATLSEGDTTQKGRVTIVEKGELGFTPVGDVVACEVYDQNKQFMVQISPVNAAKTYQVYGGYYVTCLTADGKRLWPRVTGGVPECPFSTKVPSCPAMQSTTKPMLIQTE